MIFIIIHPSSKFVILNLLPMENKIILDNLTFPDNQNTINQSPIIPNNSKIKYRKIIIFNLFIILCVVGVLIFINKNKTASNNKSVETNRKTQASSKIITPGYIFQTFVRGKVCAYIFGSDPSLVDPNCKYWSVNPLTGVISKLPENHPYFKQFYIEQKLINKLYENKLQKGVCTVSESEEVCIIDISQDNEDKFLYTSNPKNNFPISVWIRTVDNNQKEKIIEDTKKTGCEGGISSWSENSGDILFTTQWDGTPKSPSGEMLKSLCVYNYKTKKVVYSKLLPVDTYNIHLDDMIQGRIFLYGNLLIDYRNNQEDNLSLIKGLDLLYDENEKLFRSNKIMTISKTSDTFVIKIFDITTNKFGSQNSIDRIKKVETDNPLQSDYLRFIAIKKDKTHIILEHNPSNNYNTPEISSCFYDYDVNTSQIQKIACSHQFQSLYPGLDPSKFDQFVYVDFLDWSNQIQEKEITNLPTPTQPIPQSKMISPTNFQDSFNYKLPFKEYTVILNRMGSGKIEGSFWERPVKDMVDFDVDPLYPHETLSMKGYLYYVRNQNIFYDLEPNGFSTLSLISETDLKSRVINEKQNFKQISCEMSNFPLGITVKAIKCTTIVVNPENLNQTDESFIKNCYLPLKNGQYLAYEQKVKPMGDVDLCEALTKMGIQDTNIE